MKLSLDQIMAIQALYRAGWLVLDLAKHYRQSVEAMRKIVSTAPSMLTKMGTNYTYRTYGDRDYSSSLNANACSYYSEEEVCQKYRKIHRSRPFRKGLKLS